MNLDYEADPQRAAFEKTHWWVRSRFGLLDRVLTRMDQARPLALLEVGCGTGVNLEYLSTRHGGRFSNMLGVDPQAASQDRGRWTIQRDVPSGASFDLILAMDVLEHVDKPIDFLLQLHHYLKPKGHLLITVPAFQSLWTSYDVLAHHRKRYSSKALKAELRAAHFEVEECFFLFGFLFPLFMAQRLALKWRIARDPHVFKAMPSWINRVLFAITAAEMHTCMPFNRFFGSSIVALAHGGT